MEITKKEFEDQFTVLPNSLVYRENFGGMYETFGKEYEHVKHISRTENSVWTIIQSDEDGFYYRSGLLHANRVGYFITREEFKEEIEVILD